MQQATVAEIVRRAQEGDAQAFTELVRRYQDAVFGAAYQRVLDFEAARDIAQEAFVRAYERLGDLREPASFPGWLLRICGNLAASWRRSPERDVERLDAGDVAATDHAERVATRDLVSRALSALPADNRLALTLFLVDGYTCAEVADLTGVPRTTAKGRIERGRRQLEAEVLAMTEDTLKGEAPDEEFTAETVRQALEEAREAVKAHELADARAIAEDMLDRLPELDADEEERLRTELDALQVLGFATFFSDRQRWIEVGRRQIRLLEELDDRERLARRLLHFGYQALGLTRSERAAIEEYCLSIYEELGLLEDLRQGLFFRGCHLLEEGRHDAVSDRWERARRLGDGLPYDGTTACLEAAQEFLRIVGEPLDPDRPARWGIRATIAATDGDRLAFRSQPGWSWRHADAADNALSTTGLEPFWRVGWLPVTGPEVGYEEEFASFSHTPHPTRTRVRVVSDEETVNTHAGEFNDCMLLRATITRAPEDRESDSPQAELNKLTAGEWRWWFARGVGAVAVRHEAENGITSHAVLSGFDCPEERDEWFPVVGGTRWEYLPADTPPDIDLDIVVQLSHVGDDGTVYLPATIVVKRAR